MLNFCTLFDSNFLASGLALYESLEKHCTDFHLYVFAFDDKCFNVLKKIYAEKITVISLGEFEDEDLLRIKPTRSRREYCWTCTASIVIYSIRTFGLESCTYLDADLYFYGSPEELLNELQGNSVLITEHRFPPELNAYLRNGKYCVQFITFRNDEDGMKVLTWWRNACIEWCYERREDGRFGDQKYLDDWTTRFRGVHELQHLGGGVAPWNVQQYAIYRKNNRIYGIEKKTNRIFDLIFYHFHYLRFFNDGIIKLTATYPLSGAVKEILYRQYIKHLRELKDKIKKIDGSIDPMGTIAVSPEKPLSVRGMLLYLKKRSISRSNGSFTYMVSTIQEGVGTGTGQQGRR